MPVSSHIHEHKILLKTIKMQNNLMTFIVIFTTESFRSSSSKCQAKDFHLIPH